MKKIYNKPGICIVKIKSSIMLSGSGNPKINIYTDEKYSPNSAFSKNNSEFWDEDIEE